MYDEEGSLDYESLRTAVSDHFPAEVTAGRTMEAATAAALVDIAESLAVLVALIASGGRIPEPEREEEPDPNVEPPLEVGDWVVALADLEAEHPATVHGIDYREGELALNLGNGWVFAKHYRRITQEEWTATRHDAPMGGEAPLGHWVVAVPGTQAWKDTAGEARRLMRHEGNDTKAWLTVELPDGTESEKYPAREWTTSKGTTGPVTHPASMPSDRNLDPQGYDYDEDDDEGDEEEPHDLADVTEDIDSDFDGPTSAPEKKPKGGKKGKGKKGGKS